MPPLLYAVAVLSRYYPSPPRRDPHFLRFVRNLPCIVCGTRRRVEAAHFGPRGLGQKADDRRTLPLCLNHHRTGSDSYHRLGPLKFSEHHHLDVNTLTNILNTFFDEKVRGNQL